MTIVCQQCQNYVKQEGVSCPVCGETVTAAPPYTLRDKWREAWELDKHLVPYFVAGFAGLSLIFFTLIIKSF